MNINLASKVTGYSIDAYGENQYKRLQDDQNTQLSDIDGINKTLTKTLADNNILTVNDLMDAEEDSLTEIISLSSIDIENIYSVVQAFIEREIIDEESVDDLDESLNIELSSEKEDEEE